MGRKFLNDDEMRLVAELKNMGILRTLSELEMQGLAKNGGIAILCGDGDIDAGLFHRNVVSSRPHGVRVFGGPPIFAKSFRGYDTGFVEGLMRNMGWGRNAKTTRTKFLYPHWPCGVGSFFGYSMIEWMNLMLEVEEIFHSLSPNVHDFFHVTKKFPDGHEEENTYRLILPKSGIKL